MKISNRLKTIASFVKEDAYILDVGCDHALLDIYLALENPNIKIIASDINEKPLNSAKKNIEKYKLEDRINLTIGDGLEKINKHVNTVVIAGMGTNTILEILKKGDLDNTKKLIISSNNDYYLLRKEIIKLGFTITMEKLVFEKNKYYPIIVFEKIERKQRKYKKIELEEGPVLIEDKSKEFINYINLQIKKKENILLNLNNKHFLKIIKLKREIRNLMKII